MLILGQRDVRSYEISDLLRRPGWRDSHGRRPVLGVERSAPGSRGLPARAATAVGKRCRFLSPPRPMDASSALQL